MSRNKVEVQVVKYGPGEKPADSSIIEKSLAQADVIEENVKSAKLISRADHPIEVQYGDVSIRLSPRQTVEVADADKVKCDNPLVVIVLK
jgi:hypothetical protein